jgi:hypothetical protein
LEHRILVYWGIWVGGEIIAVVRRVPKQATEAGRNKRDGRCRRVDRNVHLALHLNEIMAVLDFPNCFIQVVSVEGSEVVAEDTDTETGFKLGECLAHKSKGRRKP